VARPATNVIDSVRPLGTERVMMPLGSSGLFLTKPGSCSLIASRMSLMRPGWSRRTSPKTANASASTGKIDRKAT
jgi:hypothetical protein